VSASKAQLFGASKRRAYHKPSLRKLTPEQAKAELEAKSIPSDKQAEQLMDAINRRLGEKDDNGKN